MSDDKRTCEEKLRAAELHLGNMTVFKREAETARDQAAAERDELLAALDQCLAGADAVAAELGLTEEQWNFFDNARAVRDRIRSRIDGRAVTGEKGGSAA